ncbi:hypothetical protein IWQ60_008900 [Tieghemiomyces parasiticus]|uniref:Uncharacterized protein n=1 Tax=Tieghemiomyces parasiticus TaxID=78921 RepID=A0A9W8DQD5_9FUNG|nr:hypothetical protein IWQ60_008900 [Tieghemiomyces parasiticus]
MEALESHGLFQFGGSDSEDDGLDLFGSSQAKPDRLAYDLAPHKASYVASQETPGHFLRPLARQDFGAWFAEKHGPTDIRQAIDFLYYRRRFVEALHLCTRFLEEAEVARTRKPPVLIHTTEQVLTAAQCALRLGDLDAARNWAQMPDLPRDPGNYYVRARIYLGCRDYTKAIPDLQFFVTQRRNDHHAWYLLGTTLLLLTIRWAGRLDTALRHRLTQPLPPVELQDRLAPFRQIAELRTAGDPDDPAALTALPWEYCLPNGKVESASELTGDVRMVLAVPLLLACQAFEKAHFILRQTRLPAAQSSLRFVHDRMIRERHHIVALRDRAAAFYSGYLWPEAPPLGLHNSQCAEPGPAAATDSMRVPPAGENGQEIILATQGPVEHLRWLAQSGGLPIPPVFQEQLGPVDEPPAVGWLPKLAGQIMKKFPTHPALKASDLARLMDPEHSRARRNLVTLANQIDELLSESCQFWDEELLSPHNFTRQTFRFSGAEEGERTARTL